MGFESTPLRFGGVWIQSRGDFSLIALYYGKIKIVGKDGSYYESKAKNEACKLVYERDDDPNKSVTFNSQMLKRARRLYAFHHASPRNRKQSTLSIIITI